MKRLALLLLVCSTFAFAHKINLFLSNTNDTIEVFAYFASGNGCRNCNLEIRNSKQEVLLQTKLNEKGKYSYPMSFENLTYIVSDDNAHKVEKEYIVKKEPLEESKSLEEQVQTQKNDEFFKSILVLFLIALIFYFIYKVKKRAK